MTGCGKQIYKTRGAAVRAALGSSKSFGKGVRIYPCDKCKGLHLTTKTKVGRRSR